jgi:hypothetical protein
MDLNHLKCYEKCLFFFKICEVDAQVLFYHLQQQQEDLARFGYTLKDTRKKS